MSWYLGLGIEVLALRGKPTVGLEIFGLTVHSSLSTGPLPGPRPVFGPLDLKTSFAGRLCLLARSAGNGNRQASVAGIGQDLVQHDPQQQHSKQSNPNGQD